MTNEIKEIQERLDYHKAIGIEPEYCEDLITTGELQRLLDYITNLQEENERLKEENKHIFANVNDDELLRSNAMNYAEAQDYKSRIEKAVELLKEAGCYDEKAKIFCDDVWEELPELLDILRGDE